MPAACAERQRLWGHSQSGPFWRGLCLYEDTHRAGRTRNKSPLCTTTTWNRPRTRMHTRPGHKAPGEVFATHRNATRETHMIACSSRSKHAEAPHPHHAARSTQHSVGERISKCAHLLARSCGTPRLEAPAAPVRQPRLPLQRMCRLRRRQSRTRGRPARSRHRRTR